MTTDNKRKNRRCNNVFLLGIGFALGRTSVHNMVFFENNNFSVKNKEDTRQQGGVVVPPATTTTTFRFPTVDERFRYYMGSWHDRGLPDDFCSRLPAFPPEYTKEHMGKPHVYSLAAMRRNMETADGTLQQYMKSAAGVMSPDWANNKTGGEEEEDRYVILFPGDGRPTSETMPEVGKTRDLNKTFDTIIWPLNEGRHFAPLENLKKLVEEGRDTPWDRKQDSIVWRGQCTGSETKRTRQLFAELFSGAPSMKKGINYGLTTKKKQRCPATGEPVRESWRKKTMTMDKMLRFKYLLSLEGNDVATGLKWMLASSSVVFMPAPSVSFYAMEDLLVPYVHYVPVEPDGSDLEEKLGWARRNDDTCRWISQQATKYMEGLWTSPRAQKDHALLKRMLGKTYQERFGTKIASCLGGKDETKHVLSPPLVSDFTPSYEEARLMF